MYEYRCVCVRAGTVQKSHGSVCTSVQTPRYGIFTVRCRIKKIYIIIIMHCPWVSYTERRFNYLLAYYYYYYYYQDYTHIKSLLNAIKTTTTI